MIDVDGLSRRLGRIMVQHLCVSVLLHKIDVTKRPLAYTRKLANTPENTKLIPSEDMHSPPTPILTSSLISSTSIPDIDASSTALVHLCTSTTQIIPNTYLHSVPVLLTIAPSGCVNTCIEGNGISPSPTLLVADSTICTWVCVNDILVSFISWSLYGDSESVDWNIVNYCTCNADAALFKILHPGAKSYILSSFTDDNISHFMHTVHIYGWDSVFIPYRTGNITTWLIV